MVEERFSLKDHLFNSEKVALLAGWMADADPGFDAPGFRNDVMVRLPELELKERIAWIADRLIARLPASFDAAADVIEAALPPPLDPTKTDDDFGDFIIAPFGVVVEQMGLGHPARALDLFEALTQRFSMELSIRAFLDRWPDEVLERMQDWAGHENYHVRRLVSEGTRPLLPWAPRISIDPTRPLPLLDRLHADPTRYVTRSVCNHLNDIAKSDSNTVLERLDAWHEKGVQASKELDWMTRHALRTLVKQGEPRSLEMLGYHADAEIEIVAFDVSPTSVEIGGAMEIDLQLRAPGDERVMVDYVIEFVKANGRRREKVFKLKTASLRAGQSMQIKKRHVFKGNATTFTLHPGPHVVHLQVNGRRVAERGFDLTSPSP